MHVNTEELRKAIIRKVSLWSWGYSLQGRVVISPFIFMKQTYHALSFILIFLKIFQQFCFLMAWKV